jgi:hypothetical protein
VETKPRATTPLPINQVLVDTPVFNVCDAAEVLGDLTDTTIAGTKTAKITNKLKATTSSPTTLTPTTRINQRQIQECS